MTPYLHGNGKPCPTCDGAGRVERSMQIATYTVPCKRCRGTGIVARPIRKVIRDTVRQARQPGG